MEFLTDLLNNNPLLFGFGILVIITFFGIMLLQWFKSKTGVDTDALVDGLKEVNKTAQEETAKELKKSVERIVEDATAKKVIEAMTESKTIDTGNGESVTIKEPAKRNQREIKEPAKNKYAVRDETGQFVKADGTEKRKVGRPRKGKTSIIPTSTEFPTPKSAKDRP
ncbi:MAG: hypothetical protein M9949_04675 [Candidatus Kapabacteria bacterium]|nr:hypothetical protein [Candidatus Kapabacteria bacterium]